jgi:hypothetical protein
MRSEGIPAHRNRPAAVPIRFVATALIGVLVASVGVTVWQRFTDGPHVGWYATATVVAFFLLAAAQFLAARAEERAAGPCDCGCEDDR